MKINSKAKINIQIIIDLIYIKIVVHQKLQIQNRGEANLITDLKFLKGLVLSILDYDLRDKLLPECKQHKAKIFGVAQLANQEELNFNNGS